MKLNKIPYGEIHHHDPLRFPPGFLWGTATSAYQIEGENKNSDWWHWEKKKFKGKPAFQSGEAAGHYSRFKSDWRLAKKLGHNAHRLSIEWARIEPEKNKWNENEIKHYKESVKELKKLGLTVFVTLHHFTNPIWVARDGGWTKKSTAKSFVKYAKKIVRELGEYVDFWITINEPIIYINNSYITGVWPPEKKNSFLQARKVFKNMVYAHKKIYKQIKKICTDKNVCEPRVGIAQNLMDFRTYDIFASFIDYFALRTIHRLWNLSFLNKIKKQMDFIGVNYYFHVRLKRRGLKFSTQVIDTRGENRELSDMNWEVYPQGIFEVLIAMKKYGMPIYVTENGIAVNNDRKRMRFIVAHAKEIYHAIQAGADVRGYLYWSLLDNYEWDKGFAPRFGIVDINYLNMKRTPRHSAIIFKRIAESNSIEHKLLKFLGHGINLEDLENQNT